jgi:hypothetical protein
MMGRPKKSKHSCQEDSLLIDALRSGLEGPSLREINLFAPSKVAPTTPDGSRDGRV